MAESIEEALTLAERIGYPVIVRPSFVIGGLAIDFAYSPEDLARHLAAAAIVDPDRPVRIDRFLEGIEVDVDAVCDGTDVLIPGLLEHVERAGIHSGDSIAWFPPQSVSEGDQSLIVATMERICLALGARGLVNAQFIVREDGVYLIEVNPRASRTVPFVSKVTGVPMVELAVRISLGASLRDLGWEGGLRPEPPFVSVKAPAFSTAKLKGVDPSVGPFMQSTGEVIGIAVDPRVAMAKALTGASLVPPRAGDGEVAPLALLSIADRDKWGLLDLARALVRAGYGLAATAGTRAALAEAGIEALPVAKLGAEPVPGEDGDPRADRRRPCPARGQHADAALRARPRRGGDPPRGHRGRRAVPDGDRDRASRRPRRSTRRSSTRSRRSGRSPTGCPPPSPRDWASRRSGLATDHRRIRAGGRLLDHDRLAQGPQGQRRQRDHHHGERDLADADVRALARCPRIRRWRRSRSSRRGGGRLVDVALGPDVPGPRPEHVPADDRRELDRPDEARRAGSSPMARRTPSRTGPSPAGTGRRSR